MIDPESPFGASILQLAGETMYQGYLQDKENIRAMAEALGIPIDHPSFAMGCMSVVFASQGMDTIKAIGLTPEFWKELMARIKEEEERL